VGTKNIQIMEDLGVGKKHKLVVGMGPGQIGGVHAKLMCMGGDVGQCFFSKWQWICHWWSLK
jgi:hypothetical protein